VAERRLPKTRTIHSQEDLASIAGQIAESASSAIACLVKICAAVSPLEALRRIKFESVGFDPLGPRPLNLVEQINQTFTYLATLEAVRYLLRQHPESGPFTVNLGNASGRDISSPDGKIIAEVFAAVTPNNNQKLKKDVRRVNSAQAERRYVFYACPGVAPGDKQALNGYPEVRIVSLGMTFGADALRGASRPLTMHAFHYNQGHFFCEQVSVESMAERFGTPVYIYSQTAILDNFRRIDQGLCRVPHLLCYSVKANSNLRILALLREAGAGFDIVSGGELARALRVGAQAERIVFSGVGKTEGEVDAGLQAGILMFNVESAGELDLIESRARHLGRRAHISVRINPDVEAETHPYISTGQSIHKFGVPKDEVAALYRRAARSEHLRVRGVACHIGSQILEVEPFLRALDELLDVAWSLKADGIGVDYLDLGGGFGIRYAHEQPLDCDRLTQGLETRISSTPYRLIVEPGRAVVGDAGILVTRVLYVKRNQPKNFIVVDAGMSDLMRPSLYGSYHEIIPIRPRPCERFHADVVGPLCETGDFLAEDREMPDVRSAELLAILTTGAYGYVLASNYNTRPRPAEVLVHGDQVELVRRRESVQDLMAGETL
jgi:diaminopimelate decarboxylase